MPGIPYNGAIQFFPTIDVGYASSIRGYLALGCWSPNDESVLELYYYAGYERVPIVGNKVVFPMALQNWPLVSYIAIILPSTKEPSWRIITPQRINAGDVLTIELPEGILDRARS